MKKLCCLMLATVLFIGSSFSVQAASYSGSKAAEYARKYALNYNTNYFDYRTDTDWRHPDGRGDCANFVSQCLHAGGLRKCKNWTGGKNKSDNTASWMNCVKQKDYIIDNGLGKQVATYKGVSKAPEVCSDIYLGTVVYYDWTDNGSIDHVGIASMTDYVGRDCICAHTNNRLNAIWTLKPYIDADMKTKIKYYIVKIYS